MGATANLSATALAVDPGGTVSTQVLVRNTGTVVDQFTCEVLGDAAPWASVDPPTLSLFPGGEGTATVTFSPPRSAAVPPGPIPFGVRAISKEDPEGSVVEEGTVEVGRFVDATAELIPRTSTGRRAGTHVLAFDNRGNGRVNATLFAQDADSKLGFELVPPGLVAEPGTATFAKVVVKPHKRFWRGPALTHPFQVLIEPEAGEPLALDATMVQIALLPKWFWRAILLALALMLLLVVLWLTVLKPTIESAAGQAAEEAAEEVLEEVVDPLAEEVAALEEAAEEAAAGGGGGGGGGETPPGGGGGGGGGAPPGGGGGGGGGETPAGGGGDGGLSPDVIAAIRGGQNLGDPFDFRLARSVAAGAERADAREIPAGATFSLTDIVLQNPGGDRGLLQVKRGNDDILIEVRLENFRDLDYHFVAPVTFGPGTQVVVNVRCEVDAPLTCNSGAYFNGFISQGPASPAPTPSPTP